MRRDGHDIQHWAVPKLLSDLSRVRTDLRAMYWHYRQPNALTYRGVRLGLEPAWATPRIRYALYNGYYEEEEYNILMSTLRPGDRYLELGGGIGFLATCACQVVGDANVAVYEADPRLVAVVDRTTKANGFNPTIEHGVLVPQDSPAQPRQFFIHDDFWSSSLQEAPDARREEVRAEHLYEAFARFSPTYLAVDIEGGETDLLLPGAALPDHVRAMCLELHPAATGVEATRALVGKLLQDGFTIDFGLSVRQSVFFYRM
jgi:FkbM family methyltransferase